MSIAGGGLPPDDCSPGTESHCDDGHWVSQLGGEIENRQLETDLDEARILTNDSYSAIDICTFYFWQKQS